MLRLPLILSLVVGSNALLLMFGSCPDVETIEKLNTTRYLGKWYEAERYFSISDLGSKCGTFNYSLEENGSLKLVNTQVSALTGIASTIVGNARQIVRGDDPKFIVSYKSLPIQYPTPHWVLGTDYDSYSVVWSCSNMGIFSMRSAWILTREHHPSIPVLENAYQILDKNHISRAYFSRTDQKNCQSTSN